MKHPFLSTASILLALIGFAYIAMPTPCEAGKCPEGESLECVETQPKCVTKTRSNTVRNDDGTIDVEVEEYEDCSKEECVDWKCQ